MTGTDTTATVAGLLDLPAPILAHMLKFLPFEDIAKAARVCRKLHESALDNALWEDQLKQFSPERHQQLEQQQERQTDASTASDANDAADSHSKINYHTEFISLWRLVNEDSYNNLSPEGKDFLVQVKRGILPKISTSTEDAAAATPMTPEQLITFLNTEDSNGLYPINWAAKLNYQYILDAWYQQIEPLYRDTNGNPDFTMRVKSRPLLFWRVALNQQSLLDDIIDETNSSTALLTAALCGYDNIVKYLLEKTNSKGQLICDINATDENGRTALHWAAMNGHANVIRELLAHINDPEEKARFINATAGNGRTALSVATINGHANAVKALFAVTDEQGQPICDLYATDDDGETALHWAAATGHANILRELLAHLDTPEEKARFINTTDEDGNTALHWAANYGRVNAVKALLAITDAAGKPICDINATDENGYTALHWAARNGYTDVVKALFAVTDEQGQPICDINATDKNGYTALHLAAEYGRADALRELLAHLDTPEEKARFINATNNDGHTALYLASKYGHADVVDIFKWDRTASKHSTPRQQTMAVLDTIKPFSISIALGVKSRNVFTELYKMLNECEVSVPLEHIKTNIAEKRNSFEDPKDQAKFKNLQAYLVALFDSAISLKKSTPSLEQTASATSTTFFKPADTLNDQINKFKQQVADAIKTDDGRDAVTELLTQEKQGGKYESGQLSSATEKTFTQLDAAFNAIKEQVKERSVLDLILNNMQAAFDDNNTAVSRPVFTLGAQPATAEEKFEPPQCS